MEPVNNVCSGIPDVSIGAPPGKENEIMPLPAVMGLHHSGMPVIVSRWQPTPEELNALADGGSVYLYVFSGVMVPVMLTTDAPVGVTQYLGAAPQIISPDHPDYARMAVAKIDPPGPPDPPRTPFRRVG